MGRYLPTSTEDRVRAPGNNQRRDEKSPNEETVSQKVEEKLNKVTRWIRAEVEKSMDVLVNISNATYDGNAQALTIVRQLFNSTNFPANEEDFPDPG